MNRVGTESITENQLAKLYEHFYNNQDHTRAERVLDLLEKRKKNECVISFAGHFSAGKSTMINRLMGEELLPQSPIPTSANIVKISAGEPYANVYFYKEDPIHFEEPYDIETIKGYSKDGDLIKEIEISKRTKQLSPQVVLYDTPGIDSSRDADRIITEGSIHLVDVLFYVMDYNHVQSEVNLEFLKQMQEREKKLYIVVNQIDKHKENELSFETFTKSIEQTFNQWGIEVESIFYTSLRDEKHPRNQFGQLRSTIQAIMSQKEELIKDTIRQSSKDLVEQHIQWMFEQKEDELEELEKKARSCPVSEDMKELQDELDTLREQAKEADKDLTDQIDQTLKNAYMMPFDLREKADQFLESQQKSFKIGILGAKKKTEEARQQRLQNFYDALLKQVEANVQWKLRDKLLDAVKAYHLDHSGLEERIQSLKVSISESALLDLIKPGARLSGEYLLVYTEDVSQFIKSKYRQEAIRIRDEFVSELTGQNEEKIERLQTTLTQSKQHEGQLEKLQSIRDDIHQSEERLRYMLVDEGEHGDAIQLARKKLKERKPNYRSPKDVVLDQKEPMETFEKEIPILEKERSSFTVDMIQERLQQASNLLGGVSGFQTITADLKSKRDRLCHQRFTVALFGAFSAGKSSFANAVLGEQVLPVSPNPTTAAINKISPPDSNHPHGSITVQLKTEQDLLLDLEQMLQTDHPIFSSLEEYVRNGVVGIEPHVNQTLTERQRHFLQAICQGFERNRDFLGKQITIEMDEFSSYVSEESIACYVAWMELFYDCELTRKGITLVDTPGADSVNARHTDVSFEYIKNADAIIFVTYYNHPFSRADKDFLIQLGRVKDAFSLDKMFFIINASDLAQNQEELDLVTTYMDEQLRQFGITAPKLFPLSSYDAIQAKLNKKEEPSGFSVFEESFYSFIEEDLVEMLIHSSLFDLKRVQTTLSAYLEDASLSNEEKQSKLRRYEEEKDTILDRIVVLDSNPYRKQIQQKLEKQLYYVSQRIFIEFNQKFKEEFNPSIIKGSAKEARIGLETSLVAFLNRIKYELEQEIRAVSLRMERFGNDKLKEVYEQLELQSVKVNDHVSFASFEDRTWEAPTFPTPFQGMDKRMFHSSLQLFKNAKAFFEKNEKEEMKESLEEQLQPFVKEFLGEVESTFWKHYEEEWMNAETFMKEKAKASVKEFYDGYQTALSQEVDVEELKSKLEQMNTIM
ncbi:dynamin family protein [Radiobacillus kanasensis]|uniref:dynamin family protein n=1 Tax=Radiobacillus kanasensis TaxID=2844358 RepID=UPI001E37774A|nr:dynamin family protein [Radiobacillus kanasensis]UFU01158.1 dynamin family protein [Radiobacillus kanasensis]